MARAARLPRRGGRVPAAAVVLLAAALFASAAGCTTDRTPELLGAWQAELLVEESDTVEVRLDDVGIRFDADGSYYYTSTLDYEEEGTYRLDGDLLYRRPKGQTNADDRPVQIARLDADALHLDMEADGKKRRLEFSRLSGHGPAPDDDPTHDHGHDHGDHDHDHEH